MQLFALKGGEAILEPINLNKETEGSSSNRSENSSDINLGISRIPAPTIDSQTDNISNQGIAFFPSYKQQTMNQLLQASTRSELHCSKAEHGIVGGQEAENFCSIFGGIDDQSAFWAWSEQHNFHWWESNTQPISISIGLRKFELDWEWIWLEK